MKKPLLFCLLALSMIMFSCNKDENETETEATNEEILIGTWLYQSLTVNGEPVEYDSCKSQLTFTFDEDNNLINSEPSMGDDGECESNIYSGTYTLEGSNLTFVFTNDEGSETFEQTFEISNNVLTIVRPDDDGDIVGVFKKLN